jgi:DNA gyrase subunit A
MSIRFEASQARSMGRGSMGVRGIDLREGDRVVGLGVVEDDEAQVLTIGAHGYGKRTPLREWTLQKRGGLGRIAM